MSVKLILGFLARLLGWTLVFAALYYWFAPFYMGAVLALADLWVDAVFPLSLMAHPHGIVVMSATAPEPMGLPYRLDAIGLNLIFAPALVLATLGAHWSALPRAAAAILIMLLLHSLQILLILLFYLIHPDNTLMSVAPPPAAAAAIRWSYSLLDRMGYALFPFLAWAITCPRVLAGTLGRSAVQPSPATALGQERREDADRIEHVTERAPPLEQSDLSAASVLSLEEVGALADARLLARAPAASARILLVAADGGPLARALTGAGHQVRVLEHPLDLIDMPAVQAASATALAEPSTQEERSAGESPPCYDLILSRGALRGIRDLTSWVAAARHLLAKDGRLILCEEVSHGVPPDAAGKASIAEGAHPAWAIEQALGAAGFYVEQHADWGQEAADACWAALRRSPDDGSDDTSSARSTAPRALREWLCSGVSVERLGVELWVLAPSDLVVRGYRPGDEQAILSAFNQVFHTNRTLAHWRWKYLDNPYGQTWTGLVWDGDRLVAQYAAYPVPLYLQQRMRLGCQAADAFSLPAYRKVGHGATAVMSRAFRLFERVNCEPRLAFGHGFNVNKIQKLGQRFWRHQVPAPVYQRILDEPAVDRLRARPVWPLRWRGYRVVVTPRVDDWADRVFVAARDDYGWLVARDRPYLTWRYQQCPDMEVSFVVVYHGRRPVGWMVGRRQETTWLLGDALFERRHAESAASLALRTLLRRDRGITRLDSWFAEAPVWWSRILDDLGFIKQRQHQELDLVVRFYQAKLSPQEIAEHFYFTWGDSDLY